MAPRSPRRARTRLALALVLGATAVVAGCGGTPSGTPAASGSPAPSVTPADSTGAPSVAPGSGAPGPSVTPLPPGSFSFDLPAGWRVVQVEGDHEALIASLRPQSPAVAASLADRLANLSSSTTYVAFDASPGTLKKGDLVMLIVTEVALPLDVTLETFATTVKNQVQLLVETDLQLRPILITAGQASSLAYVAPLTRPDGKAGSVAVTQVYYVLPGRGYVLTFAAPPDRVNDYAQAIADIATSFTIRT